VVAVGNLDRVWLAVPEDASPEEFNEKFQNYFKTERTEVLDAAEKSFAYNSFNNAYFSVRDVRSVEDLTLDQLLDEKGIAQPPNIIAS
jgi:hypothetical protein